MQRLIVLRGAPSSGKSTIAKSYRNFEEKVAWLKVDNFKDFFAEDSSLALKYVNGAAVATLEYLLKQGFSAVMEGVFQDTAAIDRALRIANENSVPAKVFELEVPVDVLLQRDKNREGVPEGLRKQLPDEVITRIFNILKDNPYQGAVKLDTVNNSLEQSKQIIDQTFNIP